MSPKILIITLLIACTLNACTDTKADEKALMGKVIGMHDSVMSKSELAMKYKTAFDSIIKSTKDTSKIHTAANLNSQLGMADEAMETWMHQFNPDFTGKPHPVVMAYLKTQQKQIHRVDSLLSLSIDRSAKFLKAK